MTMIDSEFVIVVSYLCQVYVNQLNLTMDDCVYPGALHVYLSTVKLANSFSFTETLAALDRLS